MRFGEAENPGPGPTDLGEDRHATVAYDVAPMRASNGAPKFPEGPQRERRLAATGNSGSVRQVPAKAEDHASAAPTKAKDTTESLFEEDPTAGGSGDFSDSSCKDPSGGQIFVNAASRPHMGVVSLKANKDREATKADSWISRAWKPVRRLFGKQPRAAEPAFLRGPAGGSRCGQKSQRTRRPLLQ